MRFDPIGNGIRGASGSALVLWLLAAGTGPAAAAGKRADILAAGVDTMTVGTARQVERARRLRLRQAAP